MTEIKFRSDVTVELIDCMASDSAVIQSARVSTGGEKALGKDVDKDKGLINYLMRDRHGSPFEHGVFTFRIEAPIFVFREFMRHRIASYNEESGRYKQLEPVFYVPDMDRPLIQEGKPGAYTFVKADEELSVKLGYEMMLASDRAYSLYEEILASGVAREVARMVLPVNIYSSMYVTMNARSLMNFISLRSLTQGTYPSFPQEEISWVANGMEAWFAERMPVTYKAFINNGRVAP